MGFVGHLPDVVEEELKSRLAFEEITRLFYPAGRRWI